MAKAFKKGDIVTLIADWDRKGTVTFRHAVVYSCGKKRMVLTCAKTGEEIGRNFRPEKGSVTNQITELVPGNGGMKYLKPAGGVFDGMTDEAAEALGLTIAAELLAHERQHYAERLQRWGSDASYAASIQKDIDALHEPRALDYHDAVAAIRTAIK